MRFLWLLSTLALAACTVGPNYQPPALPPLPDWHDQAAQQNPGLSTASDPDPLWWNGFGDPILTQLMQAAIADNPTVQEATVRVIEADQNVAVEAAAGLPTLSGNASYMREDLGIKGILQSKGAYDQLNNLADQSSPLNQIAPGDGNRIAEAGTTALNQLAQPVNLYQYGLSSSWELDLFGRVRRGVEQAKANAEAEREAANDALVMLESEVAQAYLQLRGAQQMQEAQLQAVQTAQQSLQLTQDRAQRGLTSDVDVEQAQTQLDNEESQEEMYEKQVAQAIYQLDMLAGQPPGRLDNLLAQPAALPALPPVVGVGLPAGLARRRPDIRQAEAQLHAATAGVGVAVADFYPDISLTGNIGLRATDASYLTKWASLFYAAGPSISLPIFQGGELAANLKLARAEETAAALNYRGTVLNALREVEDALVSYRTDLIARDKVAATVQSAQQSYYLANDRYRNGLSSYLDVLDPQRTLLAARQQLVQANQTLATDIVTLYTALGGGWQSPPAPTPSVATAPPPLPAAVDTLAP